MRRTVLQLEAPTEDGDTVVPGVAYNVLAVLQSSVAAQHALDAADEVSPSLLPGRRGGARTGTLKLKERCPRCGGSLSGFPGTEDSEVVELKVRAYRRVVRRRRSGPRVAAAASPASSPLRRRRA